MSNIMEKINMSACGEGLRTQGDGCRAVRALTRTDIMHQIRILESPERVYQALTTIENVRN